MPIERADALTELPRVRHGFFGRLGGVSVGDFASLNCSASQGDDPAAVKANRASALATLGGRDLAITRQVHGSNVLTVTGGFDEDGRPEADGLVTTTPGLALGILTADCVPVLLADADAGVIGACHAGWRGAVAGIVETTIDALVSAGARTERIRAAYGPAISAENYEVGPQWASALVAHNPGFAEYLSTPGGGREHFDLPRFVADRLRAFGVPEPQSVGGCTYAHPERYFSHRFAVHHGARAGRQIAMICLGAD